MTDNRLRELFTLVRNKDKGAFTEIYNELKIPVYMVASRIVKSRQTAEDITQEVFVRLFVTPPDKNVRKYRAYIFSIAHNLSVDAIRKKQDTEICDADVAVSNAEDEIISKLSIESAMRELTVTEREIVTLHINAGLTFSEIARITSLSLPATYRRYKKALKKLRTLLSGGVL